LQGVLTQAHNMQVSMQNPNATGIESSVEAALSTLQEAYAIFSIVELSWIMAMDQGTRTC
jgi:hypothetical protein